MSTYNDVAMFDGELYDVLPWDRNRHLPGLGCRLVELCPRVHAIDDYDGIRASMHAWVDAMSDGQMEVAVNGQIGSPASPKDEP